MMASIALQYLYHNVVLPPQLPHKAESNPRDEKALMDLIIQSCDDFQHVVRSQDRGHEWRQVYHIMRTTASLETRGSYNHSSLRQAFSDLAIGGGVLLLHVKTQNAGLIIRKSHAQEVVFEAFESSPRSADVLATPSGALDWNFPTTAVTIPLSTFSDTKF